MSVCDGAPKYHIWDGEECEICKKVTQIITEFSSPPLSSSHHCSKIHHRVHENENTHSMQAGNCMYIEMGSL